MLPHALHYRHLVAPSLYPLAIKIFCTVGLTGVDVPLLVDTVLDLLLVIGLAVAMV